MTRSYINLHLEGDDAEGSAHPFDDGATGRVKIGAIALYAEDPVYLDQLASTLMRTAEQMREIKTEQWVEGVAS